MRPIFDRLSRKVDEGSRLPQGVIALIVAILLASALITESIGIHALFGAFPLGAIIPHDSMIAGDLTHRLKDIDVTLFLPAFFAYTGMRTQISLISGLEQWTLCIVIILVACAEKFEGTLIAVRLTGHGAREFATLGILMNMRAPRPPPHRSFIRSPAAICFPP